MPSRNIDNWVQEFFSCRGGFCSNAKVSSLISISSLTVEVVHFKLDSGNFRQGGFGWPGASVLIHPGRLVDGESRTEFVHCEIDKGRTRARIPENR